MEFCVPNDLFRASGVYIIRSTVSNDTYIGSTVNLYLRYNGHLTHMRSGCIDSPLMRKYVKKHGMKSLRFEIYELCPEKNLGIKERDAIEKEKPSLNYMYMQKHIKQMAAEKKKKAAEKRKLQKQQTA